MMNKLNNVVRNSFLQMEEYDLFGNDNLDPSNFIEK
jgi:hypothetical protein